MKSRKTICCKTVHILNNCETLEGTVLKKYFYKEFFMKKWKKTAFFSALAVLVCATVQAVSPDELLLQAVRKMDFDNLNYAIRQGANPNYMNNMDKTALMYACEKEWYEGVKDLLDAGANASFKNNFGQTAIMFAAKECENDAILKLLIENGANINAKDNDEKTALMYAAENKSDKTVNYLLKQGANYSATDLYGNNAAMWACKSGSRFTLKKLLDANAVNWEQCDSEGNNAFMLACMKGDKGMVQLLVNGNSNFDIEKKNDAGKPILIQLIQKKASNAIIEYIMYEYDPVRLFELTDDERHDVAYWAKRMKNKTVERVLKEIKEENDL